MAGEDLRKEPAPEAPEPPRSFKQMVWDYRWWWLTPLLILLVLVGGLFLYIKKLGMRPFNYPIF
ncbi:MAG: hypothetical protein A3G34_06900 [Candidatus Lindowbacteria bacterium RIFCSPLOWO2_12_FULL_62_27]|nr:MAG: hypothetical protein A3G34_06900 [Candidatus Lindowbacteria bacterium RIFCSPLOWO2_12_FULL_62_27]OGH63801.1 MAG: hypothetical protein A3I06_12675 [Candidatus Lindowbacteria bacterium RIFCSPLOWO2_02_FULL_62_12]